MRWLLALVFVSAASSIAHADPAFGAKVGLNGATFDQEADQDVMLVRTYKTGLTVSGFVQVRRWLPIVPQLELSFTNRGTENELDGESVSEFDLNYLDLLPLARFEKSFGIVTPYALIGPELSYLLTATVTDADGDEGDIKSNLRTVDVAVVAGAGVTIGPFFWGTLAIETRYEHGLRAVDTSDASDLRNRTISFLIGYEYRRAPRGPRDSDRDGIFDERDQCVEEAEDANGFEDDDGCPDGSKDEDRDGVMDFQDQCRGEAEDPDGIEDQDGCPDVEKDDTEDTDSM